jgi:ADP-heptose:LPS heptosyltransferase
MTDWSGCRKILCVRLDNMGDLIMSSPAIRAVKETFGCSISALTSSAGSAIAPFLKEIDDVITYDAPWVKSDNHDPAKVFQLTIEKLRSAHFDAAIIFTVFSQNPLPAAMLLYLSEIPRRLAYCRENPYSLLTDWVPDPEPYSVIRHQVRRDLNLVKTLGASASTDRLQLTPGLNAWDNARAKMKGRKIEPDSPFIICHPGVSEKRREYPTSLWVETCKRLSQDLPYQLIITGSASEANHAESIAKETGQNCYSMAGILTLSEFIALVDQASLVISVNTATIHIAAAMQTKVIVLYALTNPQHLPWKGLGKIFPFAVHKDLESKNEVLRFVQQLYPPDRIPTMVQPEEIAEAVRYILVEDLAEKIPEVVPMRAEWFSGEKQNPVLD